MCLFFFKPKTAYERRISDWSSDVCSSDLLLDGGRYRVVVDGTTVREIAVSGAGSELFDIGLPPSFVPAVGTPADPAAEYVGQVRMYPFGTVAELFFGGGDRKSTRLNSRH